MKTIYLAGPIGGKSYKEVMDRYIRLEEELSGHYEIFCPMTGKSVLIEEKSFKSSGYEGALTCDHAIFKRDKWMVEKSDVVFCDLTDAEKVSIGSMFELAWASHLGKHVVVVLDSYGIHNHAFVKEAADVIFDTREAAISYLKELGAGGV